MRDSPIPSRTSQDGNLRDALAGALHRARFNYDEADAVLADPAFRAALTDAIAKAWHDADEVGVTRAGGDCLHEQDAVAIVARMLGADR